MWPFSKRTYVYVAKREGIERGWWVSRVDYDPWGIPTLKGICSWETMEENGKAGFNYEWKHKSGPPIDFTRKFSRNPPI